MATKSVYTEIEIELSDAVNFIETASQSELESIRDAVNSRTTETCEITNYDLIALLHREKSLFDEKSMLALLKDEAAKIGFIL